MQFPHRRSNDRDSLDEIIFATVRLNDIRPQEVAWTEYALGDRHVGLAHFNQRVAIRLLPHKALPLVVPGPPGVPVRPAVKSAATGDGNILLLERVNER